jgi:single-stranded-DNA-specific exonuclease
MTPYLGVERSLAGRRWLARAADERIALAIAQRHGLPEMIARLLAGRGVGVEDVGDFLDPTLRRFLPDPSHLVDMDKAVARVAAAIQGGESICVWGDYDVDGATSAALLLRFGRAVGANIRAYIPDRIAEGYGPNVPALLKLAAEGVKLVVTVDCGITAFEPLAAAQAAGLDVVVIDHHVAEAALPAAHAVVDPNRLDDASPHKQLAAVGVAFLLVVGVNRALRAAGHYNAERPEPDLRRWLDLVALGTICDVVPLTGVNRALVRQGLQVMRGRTNPGLAALADIARLHEPPGAWHAGFMLGPRVNAGGRVGEAGLGTRLLASDDPQEAAGMAMRLDRYNAERQQLEVRTLEEALQQAEALRATGALPPALVVAQDGWHPGVIGIVASRLVDRYHRPVFVIALDGETGKGSGRSVRGVDLGAATIAARQAGMLVSGGGHVMAAGLTMSRDRVADFSRFLCERAGRELGDSGSARQLELDGALSCGAATHDLAERLESVGPFGAGNPEPRFVLTGVRVAWHQAAGDRHVRCTLQASDGARLPAIAFRALGPTALGDALCDPTRPSMHIAGTLRIDRYNGRNEVRFRIEDAAPARS